MESRDATARWAGWAVAGAVLLTLVSGLAAEPAVGQTVLLKTRIGNNAEGLTYVHRRPFPRNVVVLDGREALGLRMPRRGKPPAKTLFGLDGLAEGAPHYQGMAYLEPERLFGLVSAVIPDKLFTVDRRGRDRGYRTISYLDSSVPQNMESLTYIPASSAEYPDHLAFCGNWFDSLNESRIVIMDRTGQVVEQIQPEEPLGSTYMLGLTYLDPDSFLVVDLGDGSMYVIDFDGIILEGPIAPEGGNAYEGLMQLPDGKIAAADYGSGTLRFYDQDLNRLPELDRRYLIKPGVSGGGGVAWDPNDGRFLFLDSARVDVVSVPTDLSSKSKVVDMDASGYPFPRRLTFLPAEDLIAVGQRVDLEGIVLFNKSGDVVEEIDLEAYGSMRAVEYIPSTDEFAVRLSPDHHLIQIFDRTGTPLRALDMTPHGITVAVTITYFDPGHPSGGRFLVQSETSRILEIDFDGNLLGEFDTIADLGMENPLAVGWTAITSGPYTGAFAVTDGANSELVVFELD